MNSINAGPGDTEDQCRCHCSCGHKAQLLDEWAKLAVSDDVELEQAGARLRCTKCGGRNPKIEVYAVRS